MRKIKRRKTGLTVILLILVFSISIGYASLSTQTNINGNATIRYESNSITVTFDADGGTTNINSKRVQNGSQYGELPIPTKEGYTFLGWNKSNVSKYKQLPTEYQQVEYLESSGTQYIVTDVVPSAYNKIVADVYMSSSYPYESAFIGVRDSSSSKGIECYFRNGVPFYWMNSGVGIGSSNDAYYDQVIHYEASNTSDGMLLETSVTGTFSNSAKYRRRK